MRKYQSSQTHKADKPRLLSFHRAASSKKLFRIISIIIKIVTKKLVSLQN